MRVSQMSIQALWSTKSPMLQLPHVTEDMLRHFVNKKVGNASSLYGYNYVAPSTNCRHAVKVGFAHAFTTTSLDNSNYMRKQMIFMVPTSGKNRGAFAPGTVKGE